MRSERPSAFRLAKAHIKSQADIYFPYSLTALPVMKAARSVNRPGCFHLCGMWCMEFCGSHRSFDLSAGIRRPGQGDFLRNTYCPAKMSRLTRRLMSIPLTFRLWYPCKVKFCFDIFAMSPSLGQTPRFPGCHGEQEFIKMCS